MTTLVFKPVGSLSLEFVGRWGLRLCCMLGRKGHVSGFCDDLGSRSCV